MVEDGFKWFGEGFDGFPKKSLEDCVEYKIYIFKEEIPDVRIRETLSKVQTTASTLLKTLLKGFIWQKDGFALELAREDGKSLLRGKSRFGDSIDDEWIIVYILQELSRKFPEIWVRVFDDDGEFLLIEAASALPRWLNPEIADNRVWLNNGELLIVPLLQPLNQSATETAALKKLTLSMARALIQKDRSRLLHAPHIEAEAFSRIRKYPAQILSSLHCAAVTIPRRLAYVLHEEAAYITPAIEAFYLRDPIALCALEDQCNDNLHFPPTDLVTLPIKFTKVGYAQIRGQRFSAPRIWARVGPMGVTEKSLAQADVGMKLTCGFEMLLGDPQNQDRKNVRGIKLLLEDIDADEDHLPTDDTITSWGTHEDDDSWLDINFQDFEMELGGKGAKSGPSSTKGFGDMGTQQNLRQIVSRFEEFLNDETAGEEGAEFLDDMDNDNDDDIVDADLSSVESEREDSHTSFDEARFAVMMKEMIGIPPDIAKVASTIPAVASRMSQTTATISELSSNADEDEINSLSQAMEAELKAAGALRLDPLPQAGNLDGKSPRLRGTSAQLSKAKAPKDDSDSDEEVNVDYNLAKNILESFKGQAGMAGPGGNLLGLMGLYLPRDEDNDAALS
ncbi:MAG: hypothetical protein MMC33_004727 [Icmadophila ericetorum]|nr:hypothetical protein [Icmadophila ericetorum]